jgi:hypothetical protein
VGEAVELRQDDTAAAQTLPARDASLLMRLFRESLLARLVLARAISPELPLYRTPSTRKRFESRRLNE